jgi:hypothetical protein
MEKGMIESNLQEAGMGKDGFIKSLEDILKQSKNIKQTKDPDKQRM